MKKFIVYFACDKENLEFTEWQTIDGFDEIEAESAEEAARIASYTEGFQNAFFRVYELLGKDEFGNIIKSDEPEFHFFELEKRIYTAERETGIFIEECESIEEARERIEQYEEADRNDGTYEPYFYAIIDEEHCTIE